MAEATTLHDAFIDELRDTYDAERQLTKALPTPVVVQQTVQGDSAAYHGYWGLDFTRVDPHLGTNDDFAAFMDCAHRLGLKVYLDVVVNHTADVILLSGGTTFRGRRGPVPRLQGEAVLRPAPRRAKRFPCVSARYQPRQPLVLPRESRLKRPAWLNQVTRYHNRGNIDFSSCSPACLEQGDFFGLDDLFTEQPFVVGARGDLRGLGAPVQAGRLPRRHGETRRPRVLPRVVPRIRAAARAAGVPDFEIFGEVFVTDAAELASFVRDRDLPNVIDFPLQDSLVRYAGGSAGAAWNRDSPGGGRLLPGPTAWRRRPRRSWGTTTSAGPRC